MQCEQQAKVSAYGAKANREKNSSCRKALLLPLRDRSFCYGKVVPAQALQLTRSGPSFSQDTRSAQFLQIYKIKQTGKRKSRAGAVAPRPAFALAAFYFFTVVCIRRLAFAVGFVVTSRPRGPAGA